MSEKSWFIDSGGTLEYELKDTVVNKYEEHFTGGETRFKKVRKVKSY